MYNEQPFNAFMLNDLGLTASSPPTEIIRDIYLTVIQPLDNLTITKPAADSVIILD